jgi:hypothetical protein
MKGIYTFTVLQATAKARYCQAGTNIAKARQQPYLAGNAIAKKINES